MGERVLFLQLQVSIAVILVLILRQGMKRLPKVYSYILWILVFGRLLCPFALESRIGFMPSLEDGLRWMEQLSSEKAGEKALQEAENGIWNLERAGDKGNRIFAGSESGMYKSAVPAGLESGMADLVPEPVEGAGAEKNFFRAGFAWIEDLGESLKGLSREKDFGARVLLVLFWGAGLAAVLGYNARALAKVRRRLGNAERLEGTKKHIYLCEGISVPFTMGAFRPRIYLPKGIGGAELEYILCHEGVHVSRKDYLVKNIAFLLTAINWFNPFVWTAFHFMESDMEMSCDENVVKLMGTDIKRQYSQSLLYFAVERGQMAVTPLTFGENNVKGRIKNVLSYKSAKKWSVVLGIVIILGVGAALFTTRAEGREGGDSGKDHLQENNWNQDHSDKDKSSENEPDSGINEKEDDENEDGSDAASRGAVYWSGNLTAYGQGQMSEDAAVEICAGGIYKWDGEQWNCLYSGYISPEVRWCDEDGILYFTMDADYEEESGGEYLVDHIYRLDLKTGELDSETLRMDGRQVVDKDIHLLEIAEGFVILYSNGGDIVIPLVNTGNSLLARGHMWEGKDVSELDEAERNAYGVAVRERLLNQSGLLLEISNRSLEETFAFLDLDGDGRAEEIVLSPDLDREPGYRPYDSCRFQVGDSVLTGQAESLSNCIWAFSLDGSSIILALYSDGSGLDSRTILCAYEEGELREIGSIQGDIRDCAIEDGRIQGYTVLYDAMMPFYFKIFYRMDEDGMLEQVTQEAYELIGGQGRLLVELPVHDSPEGQEVYSMAPQMVQFIKIDSTYQWICLRGENGEEGWFKVDGEMRSRISELDMESTDVFELYYAG